MRVAVFGATGRTGRCFVSAALDAGHELKVLVRDSSTPHETVPSHPSVSVARGDVMDYQNVADTIVGTHAVVSFLGHTPGSPEDVLVRFTEHLIRAVRAHPVRVVILMTTAGVRVPGDRWSVGQFLMHWYLRLFERAQLMDHQAMCDMLRHAENLGCEFVVLRAARLTGGGPADRYHVSAASGPGWNPRVSRAAVAECMVGLLTNDAHRGRMPFVFA